MRLSPRLGLFGGVAVLSAASVLLQIVLTRLFSAIFGHHLAFVAVSMSLFGVGVGGLLAYAWPSLVKRDALLERLATLSSIASAGCLAAILVIVHTKPVEGLTAQDLRRLGVVYAVCVVPFVCTGVAIAGAIQHAADDMARLYLVDLVATAAGGASAIFALRLGAPRAVLAIAIAFAIAGLVFALPTHAWFRAQKDDENRDHDPGARSTGAVPFAKTPAHGALVATMLLGSAVLLAGDHGSPWLKLGELRWVDLSKVELQRWNELALVTVDKPQGGMAWMRMDASAATAILDPKTSSPPHPDEMGYVLAREKGPVLVIGAGGGRDIRAALRAGQTQIDAAEVNPIIVRDVMRGKYKDFSGDLFDKPGVNVHVADGRAFARAPGEPYRVIVISLVDTWAAASVGALALSESTLYTAEAFRDFLLRLTPDGTLVVNRWDHEIDRLLALATAGLRAAGAATPKDHLFACSHERSTALLVKREPLTQSEVRSLRRHCNKHKFQEIFAPDVARSALREQIVASRAGLIHPNGIQDLRAPTDDRPFFFYGLTLGRLASLVTSPQILATENQGVALLMGTVIVSLVLSALAFGVPLVLMRRAIRKRDPGALPAPVGRAALYFAALGLGFVLVEVGLVQSFTAFLGHPVYALSVVLVALLLFAGLGSLTTRRIAVEEARLAAGRRAQIAAVLLAGYAVLLGPALDALAGLPWSARIAAAIVLLAPPSWAMGTLAPLGVKVLGEGAPSIVPWCWGLNGFTSVLGTALGTLLAMHAGFAATVFLSACIYLVAAITVPGLRRPGAARAAPSA